MNACNDSEVHITPIIFVYDRPYNRSQDVAIIHSICLDNSISLSDRRSKQNRDLGFITGSFRSRTLETHLTLDCESSNGKTS